MGPGTTNDYGLGHFLLDKKVTAMANADDDVQYINCLERFKRANFLSQTKQGNLLTRQSIRVHNHAAEALFLFFSNRYEKITDDHFSAVTRYFFSSRLPWKNKPDSLAKLVVIDRPQAQKHESFIGLQANLAELIAECKSEDFAFELVERAVSGQLTLPSPFSGNRAVCNESYKTHNMNCLRFTDGQKSFFIIQENSPALALYFPLENIAVSLAHYNAFQISELQSKLLKILLNNFPKVVVYAKSSNHFGGVIASHSRHAHFYYEMWPVLQQLHNNPLIYRKIPNIIMCKNQDFIDLDLIFETTNNLVIDSNQFFDQSFHNHQWFAQISKIRHAYPNHFCFETADHDLVSKIIHSPSEQAIALAEKIDGCYPLVWIGVEGQKRCWLEQVEGYAYILNELAKKYPQLGVVFDGWTLPFTPSSKAISEVKKDRRIAKRILKLLNSGIKSVSVIGETSHTKIAIGHKIDFFITNFASGSLHVSRLLGKPGFCHLSTKHSDISLQIDSQIHPNNHVYLLPKHAVQDQSTHSFSFKEWFFAFIRKSFFKRSPAAQASQDFGKVSYSINKAVFYQFIYERLPKVLANTSEQPISLFIEPPFSATVPLRQLLKVSTYGNILPVFSGSSTLKTIGDLSNFTHSYLQRNLIYGNFAFGCHEQLDMEQTRYFIWLRNPLNRARYHARHILKSTGKTETSANLDRIFSAGHKALDNFYTRRISGLDVPFGQCTEKMLEIAIDNLVNHFVFIGIDEQPSASFDRLCLLMDWDRSLFPDDLHAKTPVNQVELPLPLKQKMDKLNQYDARLYAAALAMIDNKQLPNY